MPKKAAAKEAPAAPAAPAPSKAYSKTNSKGVTYYLNQREGKNGAKLYYFSREVTEYALNELPAGYSVMENERTGLPMLKKDK